MSQVQGRLCPIFHFNWLRPIGVALVVAGLAQAVTITVPCSGSAGGASGLIAAIETANSTPGPNTINLTPGCVYVLSALYQIETANGLPPITSTITINGYGATIERSHAVGTPSFRIFAVAGVLLASPGNLTLNNVTVKGGEVFHNDTSIPACESLLLNPPDVEQADQAFGGGICNEGTLTLNHSTVTENGARIGETHGSAAGGGIYNNRGTVTLNYSVVSDNLVRGNPANGDRNTGGGIFNLGTLTLRGSAVTHNTVETPPGAGNSDFGGGIYSTGILTSLAMYESVVSYNTAKTSGHDPIAAGGGVYGVIGTTILDRCIIRDNVALSEGEGIVLAEAGGIWVVDGTATLKHSLVFSNSATVNATSDSNASAEGGGIAIGGNATATLEHTILHCNIARALNGLALGGGMYNGATSTASLDRSRVVANTAEGNGIANSLGGGIYNANPASGSVTLTLSQVKGNHPDQCDPTGSVTGCSN